MYFVIFRLFSVNDFKKNRVYNFQVFLVFNKIGKSKKKIINVLKELKCLKN